MDDKKILKDFKRADQYKRDWIDEAKEDFRYRVGDQWDGNDVEKLRKLGVKALTINKISPTINMVSGVQRQNRTDFKAFPEGEEDSVLSDIATKLLRNAMKVCDGEYKMSEVFEDGIICGEGWAEVFIDFTDNLLEGELNIKKASPFNLFVDPDSKEYDLSDAEYVIKFTPKLTENQITQLFPDQQAKIKKLEDGRLQLPKSTGGKHIQREDYPSAFEENEGLNDIFGEEKTYDLTEYYYKKYTTQYGIADKIIGDITYVDNKEQAEKYKEAIMQQEGEQRAGSTIAIVKKRIAEIWVCSMVGTKKIHEEKSDTYPKWKTYPFIPYFAHKLTVPIDEEKYSTQGIVRGMKMLQDEINKRRTQELRHLNASANSGWINEAGAWVRKSDVQKYGASPGIILEYKKNFNRPERIPPMPLSKGHTELYLEATQDMKETSGINSDLLAMNDSESASGRAIHLRQQQGIVMIQKLLDNFTRSKRMLGKFILSQLGDIYTVESATRVLGKQFIKDHFSVPQMQTNERGEQIPAQDENGELVMQVDQNAVQAMLNQILTDTEVGKYDVAIGESANTPTVKYANFMSLLQLAEKGVPIPPDVLVEESNLSEGSKKKISQSLARAQKQAQAQQAQAQGERK